MGRNQWKEFLEDLKAEIKDLGPRMGREGRSYEERLARVEGAISRQVEAMDDLDERLRETSKTAQHLLDLYDVWVGQDDSGSSTGF